MRLTIPELAATTELAIPDTHPRLDELAAAANAEHDATIAALGAAVEHAIRCGEALNEACGIIGVGEWHSWVEKNLTFTAAHSGRYMRLAFYKDQLPIEITQPYVDRQNGRRQPSVNRALHYVKGLPPIRPTVSHRRIPDPVRSEVRRLRTSGLTYDAIGEMLGISFAAAHKIGNPEAARRYEATRLAKRRRDRTARRLLREQETKRWAHDAGGALSELYSLVRKAAQKADEAIAAAPKGDSRQAIRAALAGLHRAEDEIVRALKDSRTREEEAA